ncbi:RagB/SusD family nutrient uptake outer membrane protein [Daejeonella sp.]|uniref:RagB/SusD family nutrient uptake outer membrane protein n=1 Tax=Daejeonella sp. TaxID=2805397 RepID=UPI0030C19AB8
MKKRLKSALVLLLTVLSVISCKKELEKIPLDEFDQESFWSSEQKAMLALNAVYRSTVSSSNWWSTEGLVYLETASDNAYHGQGDNTVYHKLSNGTLTSSSALVSQYWDQSYASIARSNDFLQNVSKVPMDAVKKKRLIAEVRFIRACQYFYLLQHFGSVPLIKATLALEEANKVVKAPRAEIATFVIAELTQAVADLPRFKDIPAKETGRVSKQGALAFLGRIQLAEKRFADAAITYKTIIDFGDNIIDPNYASIFLESNENSSENVYSVQYVPNQLPNPLMQNASPRAMGGFTFIDPLANLMEAYEFTDGTAFSYTDARYDYRDIGKNRDPRLKYSIYYDQAPFRTGKYISHPDSVVATYPDRINNLNTKTGYCLRKYIEENFTGNLNTGYGGNTPVIRYAEVLLSYLEAKLETGDAIDMALLDATINRVRRRATVNMPVITATNAALLRPILRNERRVELALEGIRYWDLLRWGIADQALNGDFYGHPYPVSKATVRKKTTTAPVDPFRRWYVTTRTFRKGVDEYWPIPQNEVSLNPKLGL